MKHSVLSICTLLLLGLLAFVGTAAGQTAQKKQRTVRIGGNVKDSFTKVNLKAFVTVMDADSTVLDTTTARGWRNDIYYNVTIPARPGKYIVRAECDGYETACIDYNIKYVARNRYFSVPALLLKKKTAREVELDGVTVTATKVKFAYRGDTLVYNASAFNVPDGSMLDAIVRQMPGAEIKSNGDIYINGKKIDYLLLNGKDFFKGNNNIMLDNLPYYTVKELKVYNRSTEKSRLMGKEVEKKDYVMDVGLKREYSRGYIANADVAGGTKDRYMARLFGLYYTDHTRLSVYGNLNNVNETRRPGSEGDWRPSNSPQGQKTTRQAGINYNIETKNGKIRNDGNVTVAFDDVRNTERAAVENLASEGNIFSRSTSDVLNKSRQVAIDNNMYMEGRLSMMLQTGLTYSDKTSNSASRRATYTADPSGYGNIQHTLDSTFAANVQGGMRDILTNRSLAYSRSKTRSLNLTGILMMWYKLPWGDRLELDSRAFYNNYKPSDAFGMSRNEYMKTGGSDLRNLYTDTHGSNYEIDQRLKYALEIPSTSLTVMVGPVYRQKFWSSRSLNYRLDRLGGEWLSDPLPLLGTLPSDERQMQDALDAKTSRRYTDMQRQTGGIAELRYSKKGVFFSASVIASEERESIRYHAAAADTTASRRRFVLKPNVDFQMYSDKMYVFARYYTINDRPEFASLMPFTDDTNPLSVRINNPNLKTPLIHHYDINARLSKLKHQQYVGFFATGNFYRNLAGTRTTYNRETGAYTYMSDNVKGGNWDFWTTFSYGTALGKKRLFSLDTQLWFNGLKRTDFDIAYDEGDTPLYDGLTTELGTRVFFNYQKDGFTARIGGKAEWRRSTSSRANFDDTDTYDFEYGGSLTCRLPLGLSLSADIKEYCRRGYSEKSINTSDLVCNASLSRSFCKGSLTLKAEAFDILHQLSNVRYSMNAQVKSETWLNTIPSYMMLHMAYKFSKAPKKK